MSEFHFNTEDFCDFLRKQGHRIFVSGYSEYPEKIKQLLREQCFLIVTEISSESYADVCVFATPSPDNGVDLNNLPSTSTLLCLFDIHDPDLDLEYKRVLQEQWYLCGSEYVMSSTDHSVPEPNLAQYLSYTLDAWPDLIPYRDSIAVVYAGASLGTNIGGRDVASLHREVRQAFSRGYTKIIFWCGEETAQPNSLLKAQRIADYFVDYCPEWTFFYVSACQDLETVYRRLDDMHQFKNPMVPMCYFRFEAQCKQSMITNNMQETLSYIEYKPVTRPIHYVNFNRVPRTHRVMLLSGLMDNNILDKGYNSFDLQDQNIPDILCGLHYDADPFEKQRVIDNFKQLEDRLPLVLNRTPDRDNPVEVDADDIRYFTQSYFSVVNETIFYRANTGDSYYDGVFFSEKIYKPLSYKHPFILVGVPGSLQRLREIGYKTFDGIFDETYDHVDDDDTRMKLIIREITRLCNMTDKQWLVAQEKLQPIIEHNFNWLMQDKDITITKNIQEYF